MTSTATIKRRNAGKTKASILAAAFDAFSSQGYANTGIRDIANTVGVSSSLIGRYFGNKAKLFEEAFVYGIVNHSDFFQDKQDFGVRMANLIASDTNPQLAVMMVLAMADPESKQIVQAESARHIVEPLAEWLGAPHAKSRAFNMLMLLNGFAVQSLYLSQQQTSPESIAWLAKSLQDIVDNR